MIFRRLPASSSFVLAAARLRALQLDPWPRGGRTGQLRGRIQKNSQPSPAARLVPGPDSYALLTVVALMGAADRASLDRDADLRVIEGYRLPGGHPAAVREQGVTLWDGDRDVVDLLQQRA